MELSKHQCITCNTEEEIPDFILTVFPESDVICPKCRKAMKREGSPVMTTTEVKTEYKEESKHPEDPRTDLQEDAHLWIELLRRLYNIRRELYFTFHGLRCAGSKLELKNDTIEFTFSNELDNKFVEKIRADYIRPNLKIIEGVMNRLAKDIKSNKTLSDCPI